MISASHVSLRRQRAFVRPFVLPRGAPSAFVRPREKARRERESPVRPSHRTRKGSPIAQCTFDARIEREEGERILLLLNVHTSGITCNFPLKNRGSHRHSQALGNSGTVAELKAHGIECLEPI